MKLKFFLLAAAGLLLTVAACKKKTTTDDGTSIVGKTKQQVFMMQKWKIGTWTDSNSSIGLQDYNIDPCTKDDSYMFNTTTNYTLDRGSCTNGDPQTSTYSWSMPSADASTVTINFGSASYTYTIVSQSASAISLTRQHNLMGYDTKEILVFGKY